MDQSVILIGYGAVGSSLKPLLLKQGFLISYIIDPNLPVETGILKSIEQLPKKTNSDIIIIAVPDSKISSVVDQLCQQFDHMDQTLCFHTSGALPWRLLSPLKRKGAFIGSAHPLMTFSGASREPTIQKVPVAISGEEAAVPRLKKMFTSLGWRTLELQEDQKIYFHLLGVFASNFQLALLDMLESILKKSGLVEQNVNIDHVLPIYQETLNNFLNAEHVQNVLTGPIKRRDFITIDSHIKLLKSSMPQIMPTYISFCRYLAALENYQSDELERLEKIIQP